MQARLISKKNCFEIQLLKVDSDVCIKINNPQKIDSAIFKKTVAYFIEKACNID